MWGVLATALAVMTLASLPDWLAGQSPVAPAAMAGTALGVVLALFVLDLGARRRVRRAAAATDGMTLREEDAAEAGDPEPLIDFGLGDEIRARVVRGVTAYRDRARTAALAAGSPDQAVQAVQRALLKKGLGLALGAAVLVAHGFGRDLPASLVAHEMACDLGVVSECRVAAGMMDEETSLRFHFHAWVLAKSACEHPSRPDAQACRLMGRMAERDATGDASPLEYRRRACFLGDTTSCRLVAGQLLDGEGVKRSRWGAASMFEHACSHGDPASCPEARRVFDLAMRLGN
jgi:TPR repeat protein